MELTADRVAVDGPHGLLLAETSLSVRGGQVAVLHGRPGPGLTAFGLAVAGRLTPTRGAVSLDGGSLPSAAAVVDSPNVSEPDGALPVRVVIGEELAFAGRTGVDAALTEFDLAAYADTRFEELEPSQRTRVLTGIAATRPGVRLLVLDTPDRHTSTVDDWLVPAREQAARGLAVVVLTGTTSPQVLPLVPAMTGSTDQPEPMSCIDEETS